MGFRVCRSLDQWAAAGIAGPVVLTVGNFDGVHLGHQEILRRTIHAARAQRGQAAAVTFDPHPLKLLAPQDAPPLIFTLEQRLATFEQMGLDAALVLTFDRELSLLSPEDFLQIILLKRLAMRAILVGENFRFGHKQAGDVDFLKQASGRSGFSMESIPPVILDGEVVSSTAIRRAVREGRLSDAARLLGRPFALTGDIRPGTGRGRRAVFPTLNLAPEQELLPGRGVYATETLVCGNNYHSATNVGVRPTFDGQSLSVESHLLDFSEELKSGRMEVRFLSRLRDEQKFESPDALRQQIARDLENVRAYFQRGGQDRRATRG